MSVLRKIYSQLPEMIRGPLSRKRLDIDNALKMENKNSSDLETEQIIVKMAESEDEFKQAYQLLYQSYISREENKTSDSNWFLTPYHILPSTATIIATINSQVIGTLTVIRDGAFSLPSEGHFDLSFLRSKKFRLAEITHLAIEPKYRIRAGACFFLLMKYMIDYVDTFVSLDALIVSAKKSDIIFYEDILLFHKLKESKNNKNTVTTNTETTNTEFVGHYSIISELKERMDQVYGEKADSKNLHQFFFNKHHKNLLLPERQFFKITEPVINSAFLKSVLVKDPQFFQEIPTEKRKQFLMDYQGSSLAQTLKPYLIDEQQASQIPLRRKQLRFEAKLEGVFISNKFQKILQSEIVSVSKSGMKIKVPKNSISIKDNKPIIQIRVSVAPRVQAQVKIQILSTQPTNDDFELFSCQILEADTKWEKYIRYLEKDFATEQKNDTTQIKKVSNE